MGSSGHAALDVVEPSEAVMPADRVGISASTALAVLALVQRRLDELSAAEARAAASRLDVDTGRRPARRRAKHPCPLSSRELEVLSALSDGKVYKQIAHELSLSPSTVRSHLHHAYSKLGVLDRAQAVLLATRRGWI
jgi:DNA-binding NarL/FixJ family response regulator